MQQIELATVRAAQDRFGRAEQQRSTLCEN